MSEEKTINKAEGLTIGIRAIQCKECDRFNKAIEIANMFVWPTSPISAITFDRDNQEILLVEERVLHIIQMMNPIQPPRKIRLISEAEWGERHCHRAVKGR